MAKVSSYTSASLPLTGAEELYAVQGGNSRKTTVDDVAERAVEAPTFKAALGATGAAPVFACRAWVNFNGTGTVAIRASGNVASITDNGTGDYTINFTDAMPDANYTAVVTSGDSVAAPVAVAADNITARTTTAIRIRTATTGFALADCAHVNVAIFR
jgi:hypothetical protein